MITEYLKKSGSFIKWLVPFALAVFLLFGCSGPEKEPDGSQAAGQALVVIETGE